VLKEVAGVFKRWISLCDKASASLNVGRYNEPGAVTLNTTVLRVTIRIFNIGNPTAEVKWVVNILERR
jgi:hypothetical protein